MKIAIIGTGYVGLVSGVCLAERGHEVVCVDRDAAKVERIGRGEPPIYEAGLEALLRRNVGRRLTATTDLAAAVAASEVSLIAVGTPFDGARIDLAYIERAARQIGAALKERDDYHTVVVKSTVVPGTTDGVVRECLEGASGKRAGVDFGLGMNPEFLREGEAVADFMHPDRIVIGGIDERSRAVLDALYAPFSGVDVVRTNNRTAEMIKYAANSLLATLISFSNEIGNLCAELDGVDVVEVLRGVHLDHRVSPLLEDGRRVEPGLTSYLRAGCGFGGSCFPKDVKALVAHGTGLGLSMPILSSVLAVNAAQPRRVLEMLSRHFPVLAGRRIAVLGLAFKAGTDDMRESPALPVVRDILAAGAEVRAFDPVAAEEARRLLGDTGIRYPASLAEAVADCDAVVLTTAWPEFADLPALLGAMAAPPLLIDGRRAIEPAAVARYEGIGVRAA